MKNLIIVGHPNKDSFSVSGIANVIKEELSNNKQEIYLLDLYRENLSLDFGQDKVREYPCQPIGEETNSACNSIVKVR